MREVRWVVGVVDLDECANWLISERRCAVICRQGDIISTGFRTPTLLLSLLPMASLQILLHGPFAQMVRLLGSSGTSIGAR